MAEFFSILVFEFIRNRNKMKKLIFIIFFAFVTNIIPQEKENSGLLFTGNLKIDADIISDKIKYEPNENILLDQNKKSPILAGLLSVN